MSKLQQMNKLTFYMGNHSDMEGKACAVKKHKTASVPGL